jgi:hypothetical protein
MGHGLPAEMRERSVKVASGIPSLIFRAPREVGEVPLPLFGPTGECRFDPCRARWSRSGIPDATTQKDKHDEHRRDHGGEAT